MAFQPTLEKKMMTFMLLLLYNRKLFFQLHLNKQILSQYTKKIPGVKSKITDL